MLGGCWREEKIVHLPSILLPSDGGVPTRRWWEREKGERIIRGEWGTNSANGKEKGRRKGKVMDWEVPDSLSREIAGGHVMSSVVGVGSVRCYKSHITSEDGKDDYHEE